MFFLDQLPQIPSEIQTGICSRNYAKISSTIAVGISLKIPEGIYRRTSPGIYLENPAGIPLKIFSLLLSMLQEGVPPDILAGT